MMKYGQVGGYGSVPEKKRFGIVIGIILFIVILLSIGGFLYYKFIYSANAIKVFLNKTFDYLEDVVDDSDYDSAVNEFEVQLDLQSPDNDENEMLKVFNKIDFSGSYGIDYNRNIMSLDINSNYDDKDLVDVSFYAEYGRGYVYLDKLYDKYIDYSIDNYSELFERKNDDVKVIIRSIRKAVEKSLKDEYFSVEKVTIVGDKVNKTTLDLTGKSYQMFNEDMVEILIADKIFLESYANVFEKEIEDVKSMLEDTIKDSEDSEGEKYILYTKAINFVKLEIYSGEDCLLVEKADNVYEYEMYEDDIKIYSGVLEMLETKDNASKIKFSFYDTEEFGMEITVEVSTRENVEIVEKDVTNSISSEKLTEDDVNKIYNNLLKNEGIVAIKNELSKLFNIEENELPVVYG